MVDLQVRVPVIEVCPKVDEPKCWSHNPLLSSFNLNGVMGKTKGSDAVWRAKVNLHILDTA